MDDKKTQTVFIYKLYDMLHDTTISHLIYWSSTFDSFFILPGEEFSKALALYFKHTNIASFIRQLNMYGFHKVNDNFNEEKSNKWEFKHSLNQFKKNDLELLKLIKRRSSKNLHSHKEIVNLPTTPTSIPSESSYTNMPPSGAGHNYPPDISPRPPLYTSNSQEHSSNFRFIEINHYINNLKHELNYSNSKYDFLVSEFKKSQLDIINLIEVIERLDKKIVTVKEEKNDKFSDDKICVDITELKSSILQKFNQGFTNTNSHYHTEPRKNIPNSSSNLNIVPQNYPLNPNYVIFNDNRLRTHPSQLQPQPQYQNQQHPISHLHPLSPSQSDRNTSVFDPIQPIPKKNTPILDPNQQHDVIKSRSDSTYSPLSMNRLSSPNTLKSTSPHSQYPFPNMTNNDKNHLNGRTHSLPIDQLGNNTNTHPQPYQIQRNSFTSIYENRNFKNSIPPNQKSNSANKIPNIRSISPSMSSMPNPIENHHYPIYLQEL